jgi:hypothetical protein
MLLGSDTLGRSVLGQLSGRAGRARGVVLTVTTSLRPGTASASGAERHGGGFAVEDHRRRSAVAQGALLVVGVSIRPGVAGDPRPMTPEEAVEHDNEFLLMFA